MRRTVLVLAFVFVAPDVVAATVRGRVVASDGSALPGITVVLGSAKTYSDVAGQFAFSEVADGEADLVLFLGEFGATRTRVTVTGNLEIGDQLLSLNLVDECGPPPDSPWEPPSCDDVDFDDLLIDAAANNDPSALDLLEQRFDLATSYRERDRIGTVLLAHDRYTDRVWDAVKDDFENAIRFGGAEHWAALDDWCYEHGIDTAPYYMTMSAAWSTAVSDGRARPLLLKALDNDALIDIAITVLAHRHDVSALPDIDRALEHSKVREVASLALAEYHSEAADAIAAKYLSWELRSPYRAMRNPD